MISRGFDLAKLRGEGRKGGRVDGPKGLRHETFYKWERGKRGQKPDIDIARKGFATFGGVWFAAIIPMTSMKNLIIL